MASSPSLDRDQDFLELPYSEPDGALAQPMEEPVPLRAGPIQPAALPHAAPTGEDGTSLALALALQRSVNLGLLQAINRLEACVADLSASPTALPQPNPVARRRGSVDIIQWVDSGRMRGVSAAPTASGQHDTSAASEASPGWRKQVHAGPRRSTRQARRSRSRRKSSR